MSDEEMLQQLASGGALQASALRRLYQYKGKEFGRFFVARGLDRYEADDVLQETILKILKSASSFRGEGAANAWMWQIARNALTDYQRSRADKEETWDDEMWKKAEAGERMTAVDDRAMQVTGDLDPARLAEDCVTKGLKLFAQKEPERAFAMELVVEGVDGNEIADRIGRTYAATRQYLMQCRKHLAPFIKDCLPLLTA